MSAILYYTYYTGCPNKKETGTNMLISLKLDRHLNNFGYSVGGLSPVSNGTKKCRFYHIN